MEDCSRVGSGEPLSIPLALSVPVALKGVLLHPGVPEPVLQEESLVVAVSVGAEDCVESSRGEADPVKDPGAKLAVGARGDPEGEELTLRDGDWRGDTEGEKVGLGEAVSVALPVGGSVPLGEAEGVPLGAPLRVAALEALAVEVVQGVDGAV